MPPTPTQLDLINDLEAGLKVMRQDNEKITIGGLLNHANVSAATLYNVASRLRLSGQTEYVERLREVFRHANKMPICLSIDAGDSGVSLPVGPAEMDVYPGNVIPLKRPEIVDSHEALSEILNIMKPFSKAERDRILSATSMFFGIGM